MASSIEPEPLREAIGEMLDALDANIARSTELRQRLASMKVHLDAGGSAQELLDRDERPRSVELITANVEALHSSGARFRAAFASALRENGLTIAAVAEEFGVTRQRVSALLKQLHAPGVD